MGFYDAFFGSEQSQYTAYAIVAAIIAICITILLTATDVPVSNRLLIVFFVIISLVPSVFLTLFELTCIVTGGTEPNQWWCYAFAWVLAAFIIIYCIFIVIISLISLFNYNNAIDNVKETEKKSRLSPEVSNNYAKQIIASEDKKAADIEKFYNEMAAPSHDIPEERVPNPIQNEKQDDEMEEFKIYKPSKGTTQELQAATADAIRAANERRNNDYYNARNALASKQSRSTIRKGSRFTDYGSVTSNEQFEDNKYFSYDDFKQN